MYMSRMMSAVLIVLFFGAGFASAAPVTWIAGNGPWNSGANWNTGFVPNPNGVDSAFINNGSTVNYDSNALGDLTLDGGQSVNISGGSTWEQTVNTHWTRINSGTLNVTNGTFHRPVGGNVVMPFNSNASAAMNLTNASFPIGGELWFGHTGATTNQVGMLTMDSSDITATALWFWDPDAAGNDFVIDFTGGPSTITVDWLGRRDAAHGQQNNVLWETMFDEGHVTINGMGAANGLAFDDFFDTTGNPGPQFGGPDYTLTFRGVAVPEPATAALALLGMAGLGLRRRRRAA